MVKVSVRPYLRLPFHANKFFVEEGWLYSKEERSIHRSNIHQGVDFRLKRGTPILAAHSGYALASYQHWYKYSKNKVLFYKNKPVGFGYGYFVQIYNSTNGRFTLYGHLQKFNQHLKFIKPIGKFPRLRSKVLNYSADYFKKYGTKVKAGGIIGWCGDSGCTWGYGDYLKRLYSQKFSSWDGVHLHFEEFTKNKAGTRKNLRDPFGIYNDFKKYPKFLNSKQQYQVKLRHEPLWL